MTNSLLKFHEIKQDLKDRNLRFQYPHVVPSFYLDYSENLYCQEMVRRGFLDSFETCHYCGSEFIKTTLYFDKIQSLIQRNIYSFRLPFFDLNVSFKYGTEPAIKYNVIRIKKETKEKVEDIGNRLVKNLFMFYADFIRCWVAKSNIEYEDCFNLLKHYNNNDGLISIPVFLEDRFNSSITPSKEILEDSSVTANNIFDQFISIVKCVNKDFERINCPFCDSVNLATAKVNTCFCCKKMFLKE